MPPLLSVRIPVLEWIMWQPRTAHQGRTTLWHGDRSSKRRSALVKRSLTARDTESFVRISNRSCSHHAPGGSIFGSVVWSWALVPWCWGTGRRHAGVMGATQQRQGTARPSGADRGSSTKGSLSIAQIWGVEIRVHWTFLLLVGFVVVASAGTGGRAIVEALLWIAAIFAAVLIHELAHCVVARRRGAVVDDILLMPLGGLSRLHEMPDAPGDELTIAIVGPLTNFVLALGFMAAGLVAGTRLFPPTLFAGPWLARLLWMNVLLGAFNLLPALPMDGGRVLRAALARHNDRRTATATAVYVARICAGTMIVVGLLYDFWLVLIGVFVLLGSSAEEHGADERDGHPDDRDSSQGVDVGRRTHRTR
jgi:Zn-dependent protease